MTIASGRSFPWTLSGHNQTLTTLISGSGTITDSAAAAKALTLSNPGSYTLGPFLTGTNFSLTKSGAPEPSR